MLGRILRKIKERIFNWPRNISFNVDEFEIVETGKLCEGDFEQIQSLDDCKEAQESLKKSNPYFMESKFVFAKGEGLDLPPGCISDRVTTNQHYVYYNPRGRATSADPNVRPICRKMKIF